MQSSNPVLGRAFGNGKRGYAAFDPSSTTQADSSQLEELFNAPAASSLRMGRMTIDDVVTRTGILFAVLVVTGAGAWTLNFGGGALMVGLLGVLVMVFTIHPWMYLLSMVILGIGGAYLSTFPATVVGDVIGGKGGQVIGLFQMAGDAGMMVGPIVVGAICDAYSYRTAFAATGFIFLIAVVLSYRLPETRSSYLPK